jgi:hypothetical protein
MYEVISRVEGEGREGSKGDSVGWSLRYRDSGAGHQEPVPFDTPTPAGRNNSFPQHGLLTPETPLHSTWTSEPGYNFSHGAPSHMDWEFNDIRTEVSHDVRYVCPCALSICGSLCFSSASNRISVLPPAQPPSSSSRPGPSPMYHHLDSTSAERL